MTAYLLCVAYVLVGLLFWLDEEEWSADIGALLLIFLWPLSVVISSLHIVNEANKNLRRKSK